MKKKNPPWQLPNKHFEFILKINQWKIEIVALHGLY